MTGTVLRRYWQMLLAAGILAALAGIVHATIPDGGGVIHACYTNNNGSLRVVDNPTTCKDNEVPLAWSFTGPQGVQGPQGPQGVQGVQGPPGPAGASQVYYTWGSHQNIPDGHIPELVVSRGGLPAGNYLATSTIDVVFS